MAWNFGRDHRRGGGELQELSPLLPQTRPLQLTVRELDALQRLGVDAFTSWAMRGWWDQ